jgi:hypothetical protein
LSTIYEVRSIARDDGKLHDWGARRTRAEAQALLNERTTGKNADWASKYHKRWWIEEIDTTGQFVLPSRPSPREKFSTRLTEVATGEGTWNTLRVEVLDDAGRAIAAYDRNYPNLYQTFEPFRQGDRLFALFSSDYTATSVMDLATGEVIATEEPHGGGFCPVGFYVPDWWDVNDDSILPGSLSWKPEDELPKGDFGFVWGCVWGDDSSWKVQYLDLSGVQQGKIARDERFGYLPLATDPGRHPKEFIQCWFGGGKTRVTFSVLSTFDLQSGTQIDPLA